MDLDCLLGDAGQEGKKVLSEINTRKPIYAMYNPTDKLGADIYTVYIPTHNFGVEEHSGFKAVLEQGKLGLVNE